MVECTSRMYHYYFLRAATELRRMEAAGRRLVGEHDFR